ncbi:cation transporter [Desulfovibrio aminophilus]|uniref:heavy-metal-associated domain-containing protein n=1 Tax=Desulfovibrio aminophilus TaxID=81425 RepID=UPI00339368FB
MAEKKIVVKGMSCGHCAGAVTKTLETTEGIKNVKVNLATGEVTYEEVNPVDTATISAKIKKAGYEVVG